MNNPVWIDERGKIIEPEYCRDFLSRHPIRCINDRFYTVEGPLPDESKLKRTIYEEISPWLHAKVAQTVEQIIKALKLAAYTDPLPLQCDRIHVANGTCFLDGTFTEEKEYCSNRLSVSYRADAPAPEHWLRFLSELLESEDILALQEYLGYCLLPSTKGQKMLMLIGKGGEGKSRIGVVMNAIFGLNMNTTSIQKVETNRFARADLEGKLLMVDDDLDMNALTKTNYVKSIVTAELRMDLERKKEQSYQGLLYVRFLCFGNGALTALHDRSDGFFRRQIILTTKDKPADRFDDPFLAEKLIAEKEGIFLWMLEGLRRLIANHYHFTISQRAKDNISSAVRDVNNILDFLDSEGYVAFKADYEASTKNLYVYHYHLHVVYVPVVEKQILWSKRCKDKSLVGTVKETIMQVSRSKKWESKVALDEQGNPLLTTKGKKVLRTSYSVLQDDFFDYMKAAGYTDVERGERGSTEEHLTVTQFKMAQEQQRLEDVTAQIAQTEQELDNAQAAVEKKQKELQSLQKQTKEQRTAALTVREIRSMGKKTITGNITLTPSECSTLKDYAVNGILAKAENSRLEENLQQAQKSAAVWKQRYEKIYDKYQELKKEVQPYLDAVKLAPQKVRAFLDAILTRTRQTRRHDQPVHRKSQDMEL